MKLPLAIIAIFASIVLSFGQGYVSFANSSNTRISTNSVVGGPWTGTTATNIGSYYYALFVAPVTQKTVDSTFSGWTFTGNYGTNFNQLGRLRGNTLDNGNAVPVPNYSPGNMANFAVLGWSANLGKDFQAVLDELAYFQAHGVVHSPNEWIGWSSVATNIFLAAYGGPYNSFFASVPGTANGFLLALYSGGSAYITNQPQSQAVIAGHDATFTVGANGVEPISYQWLFNGAPISGATGTTYTVVNAQPSNAGAYSVGVSNSVGGVLSSIATLTVHVPPAFLTQPQSQAVPAGSNVVMSVIVTSSPACSFQWKHSGTNLPGATTPTLSLQNLQLPNGGVYTVAVTNLVGYALSSNATLTVLSPPAITAQPQAQVGYWGRSVSFSVGAQGTAPFTYQWYKDGVAIESATNATFALAELQLSDGGQYTVVVSNAYGSFTSDVALLVVNPAGVSLGLYPGLTIEGVVGRTYLIQFTTNILNTNYWTSLTSLTLTQAVQKWFDEDNKVSLGSNPSGYYRVLPVP